MSRGRWQIDVRISARSGKLQNVWVSTNSFVVSHASWLNAVVIGGPACCRWTKRLK